MPETHPAIHLGECPTVPVVLPTREVRQSAFNPRRPAAIVDLSPYSPAVIAAGKELRTQVNLTDASDVVTRKKARMVLLAGAPNIRAQILREFASFIARPVHSGLDKYTLAQICLEADALADDIEAGEK